MEEQLLQQIKYYLSGKITKEEYAELSEGYITHHGDKLNSKNAALYKKFIELIPEWKSTIYISQERKTIESPSAPNIILEDLLLQRFLHTLASSDLK